jgi:diguanylate cyclase (GGDEF)-like protein/PAS domain S-box-containing protein
MEQNAPGTIDATSAELEAAEHLAGLGRWRWRPGSRLITLSIGMARIAGTRDQLCEIPVRACLRMLSGADRKTLFGRLRLLLVDREARDLELSVTGQDGGVRVVLTMFRVDPDGSFWGVCHDVTMVRLVAAALDRSESRWEIALESARQGVWDADIENGTVYHSRTWRTLRGMKSGFDPRDSHEDWLTRVHPDDLEHCLDLIRRQHAGELHRVVMEYRERHVDGHYMWISSIGSPIDFFPDGRPKRIIGTDTEITDRKIAEGELQTLSQRLALALDVSKIGVFEANLVTGEVYRDFRMREMYGHPTEGPIAKDAWEKSLHPEDSEGAQARVWAAVHNQTTYQSEFRVILPTGDVRTIRTKGTYHRDANGTGKMLGANWDVTEEVRAKQELERAKELAEARNRELEEAKARLEHNSLHDTLTSLPNRRYLDEWLNERAAGCHANGGSIALLHIDLDRFKQINDTLGHVAGDAMLIHAAQLLRNNVTADDFVARVGGDEFIVVCVYDGPATRLDKIARGIVEQMRQPVPYEGHFCRFGASIGIAVQSGRAVDSKRLLIDADIALYRAKRRGKNGYEFFSEALQAETVNTKRVADDILRGIEQSEFFPYYQPLFDAKTLALVGVEALARWQHPHGVLAPASFLKIAEDLNVVTSIDRIILERALDDFEHWRKEGFDVPSISVNVSFRRLHDENLIQSLRDLPIRPGTLSFELLESIFLDEPDDIVAWNLEQVRDLGIDVNIDDFGTGHASILSLVKLRPRRFKIDRQFIESIASSESQRSLVGSLVDIGRSLSIQVVAEGVETMEQAQILRDLGCDILQGYVFARPMPAEALVEMLRHQSWRKAS